MEMKKELSEAERQAMITALLAEGKVIVIKDPSDSTKLLVYSSKPIDFKNLKKEDIVRLS